MGQLSACRPWLDAELAVVKPEILVCLGATAAQAVLGPSFRVTERRGEVLDAAWIEPKVIATVHPSSILRARDDRTLREQRVAFVRDLAQVRLALAG